MHTECKQPAFVRLFLNRCNIYGLSFSIFYFTHSSRCSFNACSVGYGKLFISKFSTVISHYLKPLLLSHYCKARIAAIRHPGIMGPASCCTKAKQRRYTKIFQISRLVHQFHLNMHPFRISMFYGVIRSLWNLRSAYRCRPSSSLPRKFY